MSEQQSKNNKIFPLKKFGQNFLQDKNILRKIAAAVNPLPGEELIEIGPGEGALTAELLQYKPDLTVVEIDKRCVELLSQKFPGLKIHSGDILKTGLAGLRAGSGVRIKTVGNIPYNISSPIFFKLLENCGIVSEAVLMIQLEVARRLVAAGRTKDYGILAVVFNKFARPEILFKVSPEVFYPKPKVWSAVVRLSFNNPEEYALNGKQFLSVVKASFGNRRKVLRNSLKNSIYGSLNLDDCPIDLQKRAEELSVADFTILTAFIQSRLQSPITNDI